MREREMKAISDGGRALILICIRERLPYEVLK